MLLSFFIFFRREICGNGEIHGDLHGEIGEIHGEIRDEIHGEIGEIGGSICGPSSKLSWPAYGVFWKKDFSEPLPKQREPWQRLLQLFWMKCDRRGQVFYEGGRTIGAQLCKKTHIKKRREIQTHPFSTFLT